MLRIGIVAGESSGDMLGAGLLNAIQQHVGHYACEGIGGNKMMIIPSKIPPSMPRPI